MRLRLIPDLIRDTGGSAGIVMALSMLLLAGFGALAVDYGYMHFKRAALQTSADVAALAGAGALLEYGTELDRTRDVCTDYARRNLLIDDQPQAAARPEDVRFFRAGVPDETDPDQVEVTVRRVAARGNALKLFLGPAVGLDQVDLGATARAGLAGVCASACAKPFIIPTKFTWDDACEASGSSNHGNGRLDPESPCEMASIQVQGYTSADAGTRITLKPGEASAAIVPGHYNLIDYPPVNKGTPVTGASALKENIEGCTGSNREVVEPGDELQIEPGDKEGPVKAGVSELIRQDPSATWDTATNSVQDSSAANPLDSPRVAIIALYDPRQPQSSGRNTLFVSDMAAVFLESVDAKGNVSARFIKANARSPKSTGGDCLLRMTRMVLDSTRTRP